MLFVHRLANVCKFASEVMFLEKQFRLFLDMADQLTGIAHKKTGACHTSKGDPDHGQAAQVHL